MAEYVHTCMHTHTCTYKHTNRETHTHTQNHTQSKFKHPELNTIHNNEV